MNHLELELLKEIAAKAMHLPMEEITNDLNIKGTHVSSDNKMELVLEIEKFFEIDLPLDFDPDTFQDVIRTVEGLLGNNSWGDNRYKNGGRRMGE